jgi:hypothetical protein
MEVLKKKYIVNEQNRKVAVQLDIETFSKIENIMENYALYNLMLENENDTLYDSKTAKEYYSQLDKAD